MAVVTIVMLVVAVVVMFFPAISATISTAFMALVPVPSAAAAVPFLGEGLGPVLMPLPAVGDAQRVRKVQGIGKPLAHESRPAHQGTSHHQNHAVCVLDHRYLV